MSKGSVIRRGTSMRLKIELPPDPQTHKRRYHTETVPAAPGELVRETRARARTRMIELLHNIARGEYVDRSPATVAGYLEVWLANPAGLNPKTTERYRQLAAQQIIPHLGHLEVQKLDESHIQQWHATLLARGGMDSRPLAARTVGHAHRVLHTALQRALTARQVVRNVCTAVSPPRPAEREMVTLDTDQIAELLAAIQDHRLYMPALLALGAGLRRGEILALRWRDIDLDAGIIRVERSLGEADTLYIKAPKTSAGRRSVAVPPFVVAALNNHRRQALELRMSLGQGKPNHDDLIFTTIDGAPWHPDKLSRDWANLVRLRKLPRVSFHALRHTNASLLIAGGLDVHSVSRRIGHKSANLTLSVYTHMFRNREPDAVSAIEKVLGTSPAPGAVARNKG